MAIDNDTRGWIMTAISGIACVVGASIICVDVIVRQFPGMRDFSISESDAFLSASLSLSFGVMLYSALYSMLPQSQTYLQDGGYSPKAAAWLQIGLFIAGVAGIRVLSSIIHRFIPSHVVDCDHKHDEEATKDEVGESDDQEHEEPHQNGSANKVAAQDFAGVREDTPLLSRSSTATPSGRRASAVPDNSIGGGLQNKDFVTAPSSRRPSLFPRGLSRTLTRYVSNQGKRECDESGPCMGFSDPCGNGCFKITRTRTNPLSVHGHALYKPPTMQRVPTGFRFIPPTPEDEHGEGHDSHSVAPHEHERSRATSTTQNGSAGPRSRSATHHYHHPEGEHTHHDHHDSHSIETDHHHHVPTNAFMSIGLQTSIAIALHKAPEGFITYATNHANPTLGFSVFMALFIHNITEGFAMSLPLYLALDSRFKAIIWSSLLGGVSQPLGAGVAALWFKLAQHSDRMEPQEGVYGGMFAITAGIMTSVALSLFSESLQLSHSKNTCIAFAFLGMAVLGTSHALTAK